MTLPAVSIPPAWAHDRHRRGLTIGSLIGRRGLHYRVHLTVEQAAEMLADAEQHVDGKRRSTCDPSLLRAASRVVQELRHVVPTPRPECSVLEVEPADKYPFRVVEVSADGTRRIVSKHVTRAFAEAAFAKHKIATGFTARFLKVQHPRPT